MQDAEAAYAPAQAAAFAEIEAAQDALEAAEDARADARARIEAIEAELTFLRSTSAGSLQTLDPGALGEMATLLGRRVADLETERLVGERALRPLDDAVDTAEATLIAARARFALLTPPRGPVSLLAVAIRSETAITGDLSLTTLSRAARWQPLYTADLQLLEAPQVLLRRRLQVQQYSGEPWLGVALRLSTANLSLPLAPQVVRQNPATLGVDTSQIGRRVNLSPRAVIMEDRAEGIGVAVEAAPAPEAPAFGQLAAEGSGVEIEYVYPAPVTVLSGESAVRLDMDQVDLPASPSIRAVPRLDSTAFQIAEVENVLSEPILPGQVEIFRDGTLVGTTTFPFLPPSASEEIPFGALRDIKLSWKALQNDTGDRGLVSRSDTREQSVEFTVENLGAETRTVETLFALPFAEQEDLDVRVTLSPQPDERDWEKERGVAAWMLELAPGNSMTVRMDAEFRWPQGQELFWGP